MYRTLTITAYDMFESVQWNLQIHEYVKIGDQEVRTEVARLTGRIPGKGHPFWPHWLQDVLQDMLEEL